jgi:hypothetical protein
VIVFGRLQIYNSLKKLQGMTCNIGLASSVDNTIL